MKRFFIFLITTLLIITTGQSRASEAGLLWKISSDKASVYLLGVLPFASQQMYPVPAAAEEAFERSQRLLVYVDLLSLEPFAAAQAGTDLAKPENGITMQDLVSGDTWKRVEAITAQYQIPQATFINQEPWLFAWSLGWFVNAINGYDESRGMDRYFLARARDNKEIIALRSYAEWLGELDKLNKHEHELLLQAALTRIETDTSYPAKLADAWLEGDDDRIASLQSSSLDSIPEARRLFQRLIDQRNSIMLERLEQVLKNDKDGMFVVVRAEQVVGKNGLPARLREAGFKVERH